MKLLVLIYTDPRLLSCVVCRQVEKIQGALGKDSDLKETDLENILVWRLKTNRHDVRILCMLKMLDVNNRQYTFLFISQIGTVEKFQGKEFNVILLSSVRSMPKVTTKKQQFTLGFVDDKKVRRYITQAK